MLGMLSMLSLEKIFVWFAQRSMGNGPKPRTAGAYGANQHRTQKCGWAAWWSTGTLWLRQMQRRCLGSSWQEKSGAGQSSQPASQPDSQPVGPNSWWYAEWLVWIVLVNLMFQTILQDGVYLELCCLSLYTNVERGRRQRDRQILEKPEARDS